MNLKTTLGERIGTGPEWHVHLAFRIGQACALVRNGNSVSEGRKEAKGCVDANKRIYAGLSSPAMGRLLSVHAMAISASLPLWILLGV